MGFFQAIGTILPTVGSILGQLLTGGKTATSKVVAYDFGKDFPCGFTKDKETGEYILMNSSMNDDNILTLGVPAIGNMEAETVTIGNGKQAKVSEVFERCAAEDSTKLMLSGCTLDGKNRIKGSNDVFHIAAGGCNVPVDGVTSKRIGSYLTVTCSPNQAVFKSLRTIHMITSATFQGNNDSAVTVTNIAAEPDGTGTKVIVPFAKVLPKGTYLNIDVEVDMGDLKKILAEQRIQVTKASEANLELVRNAVLEMRQQAQHHE